MWDRQTNAQKLMYHYVIEGKNLNRMKYSKCEGITNWESHLFKGPLY